MEQAQLYSMVIQTIFNLCGSSETHTVYIHLFVPLYTVFPFFNLSRQTITTRQAMQHFQAHTHTHIEVTER